MTMKRRDALKTIGGLGAAAGLARFLPGCCGGDDGPEGITTYVYMMLENRSYDHYFGARSMLEGKAGNGPMTGATNLDVNGNPIALFHPGTDALCDLDPPHGWDDARAAFNGGLNDGFVKIHQMEHSSTTAVEPMQYLTRNELPVSYALADAYATADKWFCSVLGPTWPNRFYWHTGTSGGLMANVLPTGGGLSWPSIYHRLEAAGVDWRYYYGTIPVVSLINDLNLDGKVQNFNAFLTDAAAGTLPPVVYIDPAFYMNDDHPPIHPINGQELIATVYTALATSPQWKNCMLVVTYDENGGFYDHVPPPKAPDDNAAQGFDQLGFRVPTMVMGPYVKTSYVSSVQYDHTSCLKHLENTFGLEPLTMRSSAANDLSDFIDQDRLAKGEWAQPIELPTVDTSAWPMGPECFGSGREAPHPVIEYADQYPERIVGLDLRPQAQQYRKLIREYLAKKQRTKIAAR